MLNRYGRVARLITAAGTVGSVDDRRHPNVMGSRDQGLAIAGTAWQGYAEASGS